MKTIMNISAVTTATVWLYAFCLFSVNAITGCQADSDLVIPPALTDANARKVTPATEFIFNVRDAGDGDLFNARLFGDIWYFPATTTDDQIYAFFGEPQRNDAWNTKPTKPADTRYVLNQVSSGNYSAEPGTFTKTLKAGFKIAIVWNFLDANPQARANYRHPLSIYYPTSSAQVKATIWTDRFRAGL